MAMISNAPTIKIADDLRPTRTESGFRATARSDARLAGGIYNPRSHSRSSVERRLSFARVSNDPSAGEREEADEWQPGDIKTKQVFRGTTLLWLAYQSTGVIYGDIGTSPLYVFSSTFSDVPSYESLVQVLSIIIWSLTIVVTIKYVFIILHADNEGEGGTFSCYSLLTRYANITDRDPREQSMVRMERHLSGDLKPPNRTLRSTLEKSRFFRGLLKAIGVLAVSMVMSDGVLTPAQSVLGAVQGLTVVKPDLSSSTIVGTSCGILVVLFLIQPFGTGRLASVFAPIVVIWLGFNGAFGIYNLVKYDHSVLRAFSPYFAFEFFIQHKTEGWKMLGGVLLAFTGVEALFADLGAFSMRAIQLSWMCFTYPCLLLAYIGQAAYISVNPDAYSNPFFNSVPPGMLYPSLVVAVLAAIVASQAIITATFQLISQIMKLSYCPQVKVVHTSRTFHGQLYVPFLNWLLMGGTILVTAVYSNTTSLGNAYGVCVMFVTFFDTCMTTLVALLVWRLPPWAVVLPWLFFACVDGLYLSSALNKVPEGAWFTLMVSGLLAGLFLLWRFGKENQWRAEAEDRFKLASLVVKDNDEDDEHGSSPDTVRRRPGRPSTGLRLTPKWGGDSLSTIKGFGIYFDKTGVLTPTVFSQFVSKFVAVTDIAVFFHLHPVETPSVPDDDRYTVIRFREIPGCYRLVVKHGFMDEVISPDLAALIYAQVRKAIVCRAQLGETGQDETGHREKRNDGEEEEQEGGRKREMMPGGERPGGGVDGEGEAVRMVDPVTPLARGPSKNIPIELRDAEVAAELSRLDRAYATRIMYVVGKEQMRIRSGSSLGRKLVLSTFLWIRDNTRAKIANLRLAMERVVEVGFVKEI